MLVLEEVFRIAEQLRVQERRRAELARTIREKFPDLFKKAEKGPDNFIVAGVDGGLGTESFHGVEIVLVRAVGVLFQIENGTLSRFEYFPEPRPFPRIVVKTTPLERDETRCFRSLVRLREELLTAISLIREKKPDFLLLDGSLVPQREDKPPKGSEIMVNYEEVVKLLAKLIREAENQGVLIGGVVKDSRGNRFLRELFKSEKNPDLLSCPDSVFLYHSMEVGEYTKPIPYSEAPGDHPVLQDFPEKFWELKISYLKTVPFAPPIRLEFFDERIIPPIFMISSAHRELGLPTVLVEADLQAKIPKSEVRLYLAQLESSLGDLYPIYKLRREVRPFG